MRNLSQDIQCPGRDSNQLHLEWHKLYRLRLHSRQEKTRLLSLQLDLNLGVYIHIKIPLTHLYNITLTYVLS
jgi:hypothetical protein